jgi:hypothetical protein
MAARGDDPRRIKQRAGHSSFSTTEARHDLKGKRRGRKAAKRGERAYRRIWRQGRRPFRGGSRGLEAELAHAVRLAAEAGEWTAVADLSRQLEGPRRARGGTGLRIVKGDRERRKAPCRAAKHGLAYTLERGSRTEDRRESSRHGACSDCRPGGSTCPRRAPRAAPSRPSRMGVRRSRGALPRVHRRRVSGEEDGDRLLESWLRASAPVGRDLAGPPVVRNGCQLVRIAGGRVSVVGLVPGSTAFRLRGRLTSDGALPPRTSRDRAHPRDREVRAALARDISGELVPPLPERLLGATGRSPRKAHVGYSAPGSSGKQWAQQDLNL